MGDMKCESKIESVWDWDSNDLHDNLKCGKCGKQFHQLNLFVKHRMSDNKCKGDSNDESKEDDSTKEKKSRKIKKPEKPNVDVTMYLARMLRKGNYTDVEFAVSSGNGSEFITFSAHKLILSLWSPYFADMFNGQDRKIENIITIKDVNPLAFGDMLRFMYGSFPSMETCKEAFEIFKVCGKFQVEYLLNESRNRVEEINPEASNVFEVLEASMAMGLTFLKECCLKVIQEKTAEVFRLNENNVCQISFSIVREILDLRSFSLASEYDLIEWIFLWAKSQYTTISKYSSPREVLEEFLPKLYFVSLSNQQFAQFYKLHEAFFDREEALSILMNIAIRKSRPLPEWQDSEFEFRHYTG